jgi:PPOX class probable F420-dependent enzyme
MAIDLSTDLGKKVAPRLEREKVIWLTTARADSTPQPTPVWFLFDGSNFLIFSHPNQAKLKNIARNGRAALNLNATPTGGDVAVITGSAAIDPGRPTESETAAYLAKYDESIKGIGMTGDSFLSAYSTVIRVTPEKLRGF